MSCEITAILTGHRETFLAGPALASFEEAVEVARSDGLEVETMLVLDRPDAVTLELFEDFARRGHRLILNDGGDPGLTRNRGVAEAEGRYLSFLDADDLWSFNWLLAAHRFCETQQCLVVAHSEFNVTFGDETSLWFHADAAAPDFDVDYQRLGNLWDAMTFGDSAIYRRHPFVPNALKSGYGHEDWHWNNVTLEAGFLHRPVPETVHFKRRRQGTQMARCLVDDAVVRPTQLTRYEWNAADAGATPQ